MRPGVPRKRKSSDEGDNAVQRLREFVRLSYINGTKVVRRMGARDTTVYSWLSGVARPRDPERINRFLDSLPAEPGGGIAPTGYEYREYKNWRGIPKPRRCPFRKQVKGVIRKVRGGFQGACPKCGARGPKRREPR
jgi:hypothetical protein